MLDKLWLGMRSVAMTLLFPGTVAGIVPYLLLRSTAVWPPRSWTWAQAVGIALAIGGVTILLACVREFALRGQGTLAPFDEPRRLVVQGLYRYLRNPMYVGVVLTLMGEGVFFESGRLLLYTGCVFLAFNIVAIGYEERRLRWKFGEEYDTYCRRVGRWIPGRPYRAPE